MEEAKPGVHHNSYMVLLAFFHPGPHKWSVYMLVCLYNFFKIRSLVKKVNKREVKWTEDDNNALYFAQND
jgi:choline-glycine betaine transporter